MKRQSNALYTIYNAREKKILIMKPNKNLSLDACCENDFAGVWHQEYAHL
jgi:hypothetical protein